MFTDEDVDAEVDSQMDGLIDRARAKRIGQEQAIPEGPQSFSKEATEEDDHQKLSELLDETKKSNENDEKKMSMAKKFMGG